jgi:biopolymer transport protein ExbB
MTNKLLPNVRNSITTVLIIVLLFIGGQLFSQTAPTTNTPENKSVTAPNDPTKSVQEAPKTTENKQEESVPAPKKKQPGLIDLFIVGGWSMWPLALCSIIALGVAFERLYFFFTTKLVAKGYNQELIDSVNEKGLEGATEFLKNNPNQRITEILSNGLEVANNDPELFSRGVEREASEVLTLLEKGLTVLASISTIAPLIGFLGTVSGMINAFDSIANADQVNAKVVAGGIKEALITTAAGLIVAIPAMSFYQFLSGKVNGFAAEVEEGANRIYKELLKRQGKMVAK